MGKKERFAFYLTPEKKAILERRFQEDGSRSMTAFIERAVNFCCHTVGRVDFHDLTVCTNVVRLRFS